MNQSMNQLNIAVGYSIVQCLKRNEQTKKHREVLELTVLEEYTANVLIKNVAVDRVIFFITYTPIISHIVLFTRTNRVLHIECIARDSVGNQK